MKLALYEVREDEQEDILRLSELTGTECRTTAQIPSIENLDLAEECDGISVLGQGKIDFDFLNAMHLKGIRYLSTRTIGYNHIDLEAAESLGIHVCNASYSPNGVADFTVMLILMCLRHYKQAMWRGYVNDFELKGLQGRELKDLTVGIIGTGRIGACVARNLSGFGCTLIACDKYPNKSIEHLVTYVSMDELYARSDVITFHVPLLPSNVHMINSESIAKMKDGVILINCARGELCDIEALTCGIENEKIGALGMDTMEGEEGIIHKDHRVDILRNRNLFYLHQFRNVIITQHMAFYTDAAVSSMVECGIKGIIDMAETGSCDTMLI